MFPVDWAPSEFKCTQIVDSDFDAALQELCSAPEIYDLGMGLVPPYAPHEVRAELFQNKTVGLWRMQLTQAPEIWGYGLCSIYPLEAQTGLIQPDGYDVDFSRLALGALASLAFEMDPSRQHVWTHLPLTETDDMRDVMLDLGYELGARMVGAAAAPCSTYVLLREIHAMYQAAAD